MLLVVDHRGRLVKVVEPQRNADPSMSCGEMAKAVERGEHPGMQYEYGPFSAQQKTVDVEGNEIVRLVDVYGRPWMVADPDLGQRWYSYTPFDDLKAYADANGNMSWFEYDELGRLVGRLVTRVDKDPGNDPDKDVLTTWEYDEGPEGEARCGVYGALCKTTSAEGDTVEYWYDQLARVSSVLRRVDGDPMRIYVDYDAHSQPYQITYPQTEQPTAVKVRYDYKDTGYLESVRDAYDLSHVFWRAESTNEFHQHFRPYGVFATHSPGP